MKKIIYTYLRKDCWGLSELFQTVATEDYFAHCAFLLYKGCYPTNKLLMLCMGYKHVPLVFENTFSFFCPFS